MNGLNRKKAGALVEVYRPWLPMIALPPSMPPAPQPHHLIGSPVAKRNEAAIPQIDHGVWEWAKSIDAALKLGAFCERYLACCDREGPDEEAAVKTEPEAPSDPDNSDGTPRAGGASATRPQRPEAQAQEAQQPSAEPGRPSGRRKERTRSILSTLLMWGGAAVLAIAVLIILIPDLNGFAYRYLQIVLPESPTLILLSVTLMFSGYFMKNDPFRRVASETRAQVDSALRVGHGVAVSNSRVENLSVSYPEGYDPVRDAIAQKIEQSNDSLRKQENILSEIYTQGLIQAKQSFLISQAFAGLGALLIFVGASVAFASEADRGQAYASMITVVAGSVTSIVSALFITQANAARKAMGAQGVMMREESTQDRQVNAAREMIAGISDDTERDRVQAQVAIQIIGMLSTTNLPMPEQDRKP